MPRGRCWSGDVTPLARRLRLSAIKALERALAVARAGERVAAIGRAVHAQATRDGFAVARELAGHGVGRRIHEPPNVLNFDSGSREKLTDGLVIAIEPMLTAIPARCVEASDGWTIRTHNRALAVHEEHTVVITAGRPLVLTRVTSAPLVDAPLPPTVVTAAANRQGSSSCRAPRLLIE